MDKKYTAQDYKKHCHNDIKKQLGIDDSRTASEKLLDRVIKVDKRIDYIQNIDEHSYKNVKLTDTTENSGLPSKKVKIEDLQQQSALPANQQIFENKLMKHIVGGSSLSFGKVLKTINILKKCLNQDQFLYDKEIDFKHTWKGHSLIIIQEIVDKRIQGMSKEDLQLIESVADCLEIFIRKFAPSKNLDLKENSQAQSKPQENDTNPKLENSQLDLELKLSQEPIENIKLWIYYCRLFTDDSFSFHTNLKKIKESIFEKGQKCLQKIEDSEEQISPKIPFEACIKIMMKIASLNYKFQWALSSVKGFLKEFNNSAIFSFFEGETKKSYLKAYNELLAKKASISSGTTQSYNIMGENSMKKVTVKTIQYQHQNQKNAYDL